MACTDNMSPAIHVLSCAVGSSASASLQHTVHVQGFLLPLCQSGSCTLREAVIVSSVMNRVSIPVVHSAAALLRLAEMPYSGTTSFFIRVLLDKKYSMPYRVVRNSLPLTKPIAPSLPSSCKASLARPLRRSRFRD